MASRLQISAGVIVVLVPCFLLTLFYIFKGILLDTDSKIYLFAAQEFVRSQRLSLPDGNPLVVFPPLFPLLLSGLQFTFHTIMVPFMVMNVLFLGIGNYFAFRILQIHPVAHKTTFLILYTCSATVFLCFVYLYSESLFYPILMSYIYLKLKQDQQHFLPKAILLTLMYLTRYTGLIFLISFLFWDIYQVRKCLGQQVFALLKEYALPSIVVAVWSLYCYSVVGNITGDHIEQLNVTVWGVLVKEATLVGNWLLPFNAGIALIGLLLAYVFAQKKISEVKMFQIGFQVFFYLAVLFCLRLIPRAEIEERTLFPIYFMFCLGVMYIIQQALPKYDKYLLGIILCYSLFRFVKNYLFWLNEY